jgi:cytoskeletal protein CcmA (bactofilin family)
VIDKGLSVPNWSESQARVAVDPGVTVSGKLIFDGPVSIEGHFRGELRSLGTVTISPGGRLEGQVHTPRLVVLGEVRGEVRCSQQVVLGPSARVWARIETQCLTVQAGAYLVGDVRVKGPTAI